MPPTIYGTTTNGHAANGYLSYPSTPVPPHHAPLALTWGGAGNGGTINSQKMLPPPPASIHGSNFGTVGAHSYLRSVLRAEPTLLVLAKIAFRFLVRIHSQLPAFYDLQSRMVQNYL